MFYKRQRSNKLDWMYASPNANLNGAADDTMEDFLLGKKNVDELLRAKQRQEIVGFHYSFNVACPFIRSFFFVM